MNLPILVIVSLFWQLPADPCPDLVAQEIRPPSWITADDGLDGLERGTMVEVIVRNDGGAPSSACTAWIRDLDPGVEEARRHGLNALQVDAIRENIGRAADRRENPDDGDTTHVTATDYDPFVESFTDIPSLEPGQSAKLVFLIPDHWVYDSNCELGVVLDVDDEVEECAEDNNEMVFVAWG